MPTQVLSPTAANHDGSEQGSTVTGCYYNGTSPGTVEFADATLRLGFFAEPLNIYIKFPLPTTGWLVGKIINSVTFTFTAVDTDSGGLNVSFELEKVAVPANLVAGAGTYTITSRARTVSALQNISGWNAGTSYSFTGVGGNTFKVMLDEVIAFAGAANISAVGLIMRYVGPSSVSGERLFGDYSNVNPPKMTIDFGYTSRTYSDRVRVLWRDSRRARA